MTYMAHPCMAVNKILISLLGKHKSKPCHLLLQILELQFSLFLLFFSHCPSDEIVKSEEVDCGAGGETKFNQIKV